MRLLMRRMVRSQFKQAGVSIVFAILVIFSTSLCIAMAEHARNGQMVFANFFEESNLADLTATTLPGWTYTDSELLDACQELIDYSDSLDLAVDGCETRYIHDELFVINASKTIPMRAHGIDFANGNRVTTIWQEPGENWGRAPQAPGEVMIDMHVHEELEISIGDRIVVLLNGQQTNLTVSGYAYHPNHLYFISGQGQLLPAEGTYAVIYIDVAELTTALGHPEDARTSLQIDVKGTPEYDLISTAEIEGERLTNLTAIFAGVLEKHGIGNVRVEDRSAMYSIEILRQDLEGNEVILPYFLAILSGISAIVIAVSLDRLVRRQSKEIAVMRTIGVPKERIMLSYLSVPIFLGGGAATLGIPMGLKLSEWMTSWYFEELVGIPVATINHYPDLIISILAGVMAILLVFGIAPARRAMAMTPLEVMRRNSSEHAGPAIQTMTSRLSPTISLGIRATFRRPGRLATTISGLGLALMLLGGTLMMWVAMNDILQEAHEKDTWQMSAGFHPLNDQEIRAWVEDNPQYEAEWGLVVPANLSGDAKTIQLHALEGFSKDGSTTMHASVIDKGRLPVEGEPVAEAVVDGGVYELLELTLGEEAEFVVGTAPMRFVIVGVVDEMERSLWAHHSDVTRDLDEFGITVHNIVYLRDGPNASESVMDDASIKEVKGVSIVDGEDMKEAFDKAWEQQSGFMIIFLVIGGAIAILVLLNTLMINLTEHDHEFATLRILGASSKRLGAVLTVEHLTIGLLGGLVGFLCSAMMAVGFSALLKTWAFYMVIPINYPLGLLVILFILVSAMMVTPLGIARLRRMDLVEFAKSIE